MDEQEEAKYQMAIQLLEQEMASIYKEEGMLKKETAEITKRSQVAKVDHERQLKQE